MTGKPVPGVPAALLLAAAWTAGLAVPVSAADGGRPLFELGLMGGGSYHPDYPAAGRNHARGLALPYIAYRGEIFRSDEKGLLRGRVVRSDDMEFDVSLNGTFPVDSDDNDDRRGMPDLDWLGEIGPRLQFTAARAPAGGARIDLELPVRAVFSTDLSDLAYRGVVAAPEIAYRHGNVPESGVQVKLGLGATFATVELMEYFYGVAPRFATGTRPAYAADAGYLGANVQLTAFTSFSAGWRAFGRIRLDLHHGAANEDSPLFRNEAAFSVGLGLVRSIYRSEARGAE